MGNLVYSDRSPSVLSTVHAENDDGCGVATSKVHTCDHTPGITEGETPSPHVTVWRELRIDQPGTRHDRSGVRIGVAGIKLLLSARISTTRIIASPGLAAVPTVTIPSCHVARLFG